MNKEHAVVLFNQKEVRRHWGEEQEQWLFSVIDIVSILADTSNPKKYWSDLKIKLKQEGSEVYEKIVQLKMLASDGKKYSTDCFAITSPRPEGERGGNRAPPILPSTSNPAIVRAHF